MRKSRIGSSAWLAKIGPLAFAALAVMLIWSVIGLLRHDGFIVSNAQAESGADTVKRGEYLVTAMGCNDCHTPWKMGPQGPEPDMSRMLSGHPAGMQLPPPPALSAGPWSLLGAATLTAWAGPFGVSYTANLTPDDTGLGNWNEAMFIKAIRTGKHMGVGRPIMPPMPWMWYSKLNDEDLKAIFAYLQSIPPIENAVPQSQPAPPPKK